MPLDDDTRRRLSRARDDLEVGDGSIRLVARRAGFSAFHFIRVFEATVGTTPHQYRVRSRLERARRELAVGRSVTDTCLELGWTSIGSFSTLFSRHLGEAPSRYQRRVRAFAQVPADLERRLYPGCVSLMQMLPPDAFRNFREA
jgi:transcriptional regulator GlxA family with amidase domain